MGRTLDTHSSPETDTLLRQVHLISSALTRAGPRRPLVTTAHPNVHATVLHMCLVTSRRKCSAVGPWTRVMSRRPRSPTIPAVDLTYSRRPQEIEAWTTSTMLLTTRDPCCRSRRSIAKVESRRCPRLCKERNRSYRVLPENPASNQSLGASLPALVAESVGSLAQPQPGQRSRFRDLICCVATTPISLPKM